MIHLKSPCIEQNRNKQLHLTHLSDTVIWQTDSDISDKGIWHNLVDTIYLPHFYPTHLSDSPYLTNSPTDLFLTHLLLAHLFWHTYLTHPIWPSYTAICHIWSDTATQLSDTTIRQIHLMLPVWRTHLTDLFLIHLSDTFYLIQLYLTHPPDAHVWHLLFYTAYLTHPIWRTPSDSHIWHRYPTRSIWHCLSDTFIPDTPIRQIFLSHTIRYTYIRYTYLTHTHLTYLSDTTYLSWHTFIWHLSGTRVSDTAISHTYLTHTYLTCISDTTYLIDTPLSDTCLAPQVSDTAIWHTPIWYTHTPIWHASFWHTHLACLLFWRTYLIPRSDTHLSDTKTHLSDSAICTAVRHTSCWHPYLQLSDTH